MRIRPAEAGDIEAILAIERAVPQAPHWPIAEYRAMLLPAQDALKRCLLVAEMTSEDQAIGVGFAVGKAIRLGDEILGELESVAVTPQARRAGVGRSLCAAVLDWCSRQGAQSIELEVRAGGAAAQSLYTGLGFVKTGTRRDYYRDPVEDAVLMYLKLQV